MKKTIILILITLLSISFSTTVNANDDLLIEKKFTKELLSVIKKKDKNASHFFLINYSFDNPVDLENDYVKELNNNSYNEVKGMLTDYRKDLKETNTLLLSEIIRDIDESLSVEHSSNFLPYIIVKGRYKDLRNYVKNNVMVKGVEILPETFSIDPNNQETTETSEILVSVYTKENEILMNSFLVNYNTTTKVDDVKLDYDVTGDDVVIGIYEPGYADVVNNIELKNKNFFQPSSGISPSTHMTTTAIIAAGELSGVANEADIIFYDGYGSWYPEPAIIINGLEQMILWGTDVINMSVVYDYDGDYNDLSRYMDALINETKVIIVAATGNKGNRHYRRRNCSNLIGGLANANNVITIGGTDAEGIYVSTFSSLETNIQSNGFIISKPNIMAPAGNIRTTNVDHINDEYDENIYPLGVANSPYDKKDIKGTSFAAPQVTGAVALLYEYNSSYMLYPERVLGVLSSGASINGLIMVVENSNFTITHHHLSSIDQTYGMNYYVGAGLMNLQKTFELVENQNILFYNSCTANVGAVFTKNLTFLQGDIVRVSHAFLRNLEFNFDDTVSLYNIDDFDLVITGPNNFMRETTSDYSNIELVEFVVVNPGEYIFTIYLRSKSSAPGNPTTYRFTQGVIAISSEKGYTFTQPSPC